MLLGRKVTAAAAAVGRKKSGHGGANILKTTPEKLFNRFIPLPLSLTLSHPLSLPSPPGGLPLTIERVCGVCVRERGTVKLDFRAKIRTVGRRVLSDQFKNMPN